MKEIIKPLLWYALVLLLFALLIWCSGCTVTSKDGGTVKHNLYGTGNYRVDSIINKQPGVTTVMLHWCKRPVVIMSDTLKKGDSIYLNALNIKSNKIKYNVHNLKSNK